MPLSASQRSFLKASAHHLEPVVRVGRARLSEQVRKETERALESHELVKVKIEAGDAAERKQLAVDLAAAVAAELVSTVGKIAILYKERKDEPTLRLPKVRQA